MANFRLLLFLAILIIANSCVYRDIPPVVIVPCSTTVSFALDIKPIIVVNCAISKCHNGDLGPDYDWRNSALFISKADKVKDRINRADGVAGKMPLVGKLTSDQIQTITCWVNQGAKDN